jgi:hypothetical protein
MILDVSSTTAPPTHDEIAKRALQIAARRGSGHGYETDDWAQAERELRAQRGLNVATTIIAVESP